jgi:hypothetical protein
LRVYNRSSNAKGGVWFSELSGAPTIQKFKVAIARQVHRQARNCHEETKAGHVERFDRSVGLQKEMEVRQRTRKNGKKATPRYRVEETPNRPPDQHNTDQHNEAKHEVRKRKLIDEPVLPKIKPLE